ncbi:CRISPR-associated endonuclease/helicase Cas3 [Plasticicumulans lactativorans]|uniref:CRISPR-associated endonuclease/helicase Cas3 n=1 Tax=Plasticicumulans lactativorans TaxID=1133106 RepID=A0A4R2L4R6_9GAMM|nr:type I-U CRISPR-associated helicase/endonuclease Cas3 [Plasticicumulans lactativorans]TCO78836.1 CRISPR-associated endonuclease/helicase Cas3 [Plasticicumulans lactativorans]
MTSPDLPALAAEDFPAYFAAVHGCAPFPWQVTLVRRLAAGGGWPAALDLPTAAGKTAVLDAALFHLALDAARAPAERRARLRIALVVDRRLVVDGARERALRIADKLAAAERDATAAPVLRAVAERLRALAGGTAGDGGAPLGVACLRGGIPRENAWAESPVQPLLILATVDQIGSRLLFRGYGLSEYAHPLHAGLLGEDTLILLDEAHLSAPFLDTLRAVADYGGARWRETPPLRPLQAVPLSATQAPIDGALRLGVEDRACEELARRLRAAKPARLLDADAAQLVARLADCARALRRDCEPAPVVTDLFTPAERCAPVVGVVVNRIATARAVHAELRQDAEADALLLIGRMRPLDRDVLVAQHLPRLRAGRADGDNPRPLYVVATQTVEVGADLDFDALVTQSAPLDALRQRFGRLNRLGARDAAAPAAIVHVRDAKDDDPVYGGAIAATWKWLASIAEAPAKRRGQPKPEPTVDFGSDALAARLPAGGAPPGCLSPRPQAPVLLPAHVDRLAQTSPAPALSPEPALWLHGPDTAPAEVQLVWRADLPELGADGEDDDGALEAALAAVGALPPASLEALSLPLWTVRDWLAGRGDGAGDDGDVEGAREPAGRRGDDRGGRRVLRWAGTDSRAVAPRELRPGDTLVVPTTWGGLDREAGWAWNPATRAPVPDLAEAAYAQARQRTVLRLGTACVAQWAVAHSGAADAVAAALRVLAEVFDDADAPPSAHALLQGLGALDGLPDAVRARLDALEANGARLLVYGHGRMLVERRPAVVAADDGDDASLTVPVGLDDHCRGVGAQARAFAAALGLAPALVDDLGRAGDLHDLGKADPRFQAWLYGGDARAARRAPLLAKSGLAQGMDASDRRAAAAARDRAGYPRGARHECTSVQLLRAHPALLAGAHDAELVEYLVGTHHGRGRPFLPVVDDAGAERLDARFEALGQHLHLRGAHRLERLEAGWPELFARLQRRYGWWGLAYLEALLRLADHHRSAAEQAGAAAAIPLPLGEGQG